MARVPMVTRTITTTKAVILCVNTENGETFDKEVLLPRTYKKDADVLKRAVDVINDEHIKAVHVKSTEEIETYYGMTEVEFVQLAKPIPKHVAKEAEKTE